MEKDLKGFKGKVIVTMERLTTVILDLVTDLGKELKDEL